MHDDTCDLSRDFFFFFFFCTSSFLVCSIANNSFTYFKLQFIYERNVNISFRKKMALHAHNIDSVVEMTLFKVVSMLIHHLLSAGNLHTKDFIIRKKKKKKKKKNTVRTVIGVDISAKTIILKKK